MDALAAGLQDTDPNPHSRVGICAYNTIEHMTALLATYAAGKVWVPLNPRNGKAELDATIESVQVSLIVADESCLDRFGRPDVPLIVGRTTTSPKARDTAAWLIDRFRGRAPQRFHPSPDGAQAIKHTGGSTGRPKGLYGPPSSQGDHPEISGLRSIHRSLLSGRDLHLAFGKNWSESVRSQDMNEKRMGPDGVTRGVRPVDDDPDGSSLLAAIKERAPLPGYYDGLVQVVYRDDQPDIWDGNIRRFRNPHAARRGRTDGAGDLYVGRVDGRWHSGRRAQAI